MPEFNERIYCIILAADLDEEKVGECMQTSVDTVRRSLDGTLAVLKWDPRKRSTPPSMRRYNRHNPKGGVGTYTHQEILDVMATPAWADEELL